MTLALLLLAAIWGGCWALLLQRTAWGRFMAKRRTWLTVVIGVGGDLLILYWLIPYDAWRLVCGVIALSSIGLIVRSLRNEQRYEADAVAAVTPRLPRR